MLYQDKINFWKRDNLFAQIIYFWEHKYIRDGKFYLPLLFFSTDLKKKKNDKWHLQSFSIFFFKIKNYIGLAYNSLRVKGSALDGLGLPHEQPNKITCEYILVHASFFLRMSKCFKKKKKKGRAKALRRMQVETYLQSSENLNLSKPHLKHLKKSKNAKSANG